MPKDKIKKILMITGAFYPAIYYGGSIFSSYEFAKGLAENNWQVFVATTNANGSKRLKVKTNKFLKINDNLFVKYYGLAAKNGFSPIMFSLLWIDIIKADIVYLISIFSPHIPLTILLCKLFKKKIILAPYGQLGDWCLKQGSRFKSIWLKLFINPCLNEMIFHVTSYQEKEQLLLLNPKAKYFMIPNGIGLDKYKSNNSKKNNLFYKKYNDNIDTKSKIIISLGRLHPVKGFDILIKAFNNVREIMPDLYLFIAGEDYGEKEPLQKIISKLNLNNSVSLVDHIEDEEKINFLKNANIFALSSHHENFGMVYAEALAAGTPIVASKNTPWEEVEKYNCGKWVGNTSDEFANAILGILNSDYKKMGENGKEYAEKNFSREVIAKKFLDKYNQIA